MPFRERYNKAAAQGDQCAKMRISEIRKERERKNELEKRSRQSFPQFFKLPKDLQIVTLSHLDLKEIAKISCVSPEINKLTSSCPEYSDYIRGQVIAKKYIREHGDIFYSDDAPSEWKEISILQRVDTCLALGKGLISEDQLNLFRNHGYTLAMLCSDNGRLALTKKLITPELSLDIPVRTLIELFSKNGIIALEEKLISAIDIAHYITSGHEFYNYQFLSNVGLIALREGLITMEDTNRLSLMAWHLLFNVNPNGLIALREGLLTIQRITEICSDQYDLQNILTDENLSRMRAEMRSLVLRH